MKNCEIEREKRSEENKTTTNQKERGEKLTCDKIADEK
jgi:hypothetical protein